MTVSRYLSGHSLPADPPTVQAWRTWKAGHIGSARLEVLLSQDRAGVVFGPVRLAVRLLDAAGECIEEREVEWDASLERYLIEEEHAPSATVASEILRFSLLLGEAFRPIWSEVGGHYFDAVLLKLVAEGDYRDHEAIRKVLAELHTGEPSPGRLAATRASIEAALAHVGQKLLLVRSDVALADDILARALAAWLDRRFSVSHRGTLAAR